MANEKSQKSLVIHNCQSCNYNTSKQCDFIKHLSTAKHKRLINATLANEKISIKNYSCECGKSYKHQSSLCKHKNTCSEIQQIHYVIKEQEIAIVTNDSRITELENQIKTLMIEKQELKQLMNDDFKQLMLEQNKVIMDLASKVGNNNTTNSNNKFNLNFFLNEQCKNAINLPDFVNSLKLTLTDLEKVGQLGYAEGISRIFVRGLKEMDVFKRPIHCSDAKRETLYVRDKDAWEKENEENDKIKIAIRKVAHNNFKQLSQWTETKPGHKKLDTSEYNEWLQLMYQSVGGGKGEDQNYQKIIKNVASVTIIDK